MISSRLLLAVLVLLAVPALRAQTVTYVDTDTKDSSQSIATNGTLTLQIDSGSATESGVFDGSGALVKAGAGTLTLTGSSTYTGGTTINAGTLFAQFTGEKGTFASGSTVKVNAGGTLVVNGDSLGWGDNPALLVLNGGTVSANATDGAHTTLQNVTMTGGLITYGGNGRYVLNGPLTTLASSGTATVDASLELLSGWATGPATSFTVASGSTSSGIDLDISGVLFGAGPVVKNGAGTLRLSGANSYTGGTTLNAGTLLLGSASALGSSGTISFNGGTLQYSAAGTTDYSARFSTADNQQYRIDTNSQNATLAGNLTSTGGTFNKLGAGTLTLTGTNTYTGGTTLTGGTLALGSAGALGTTGAISFGGGTLQYSSANTTDYSGRFSTAASQQFRIDTNGQNVTLAGNIASSGGSFVKLGTGTLTLSGSNTYSGLTTISAGTLYFANRNAAQGRFVDVQPGATAAFPYGGSDGFQPRDFISSDSYEPGSYFGLDTSNATGGTATFTSAIYAGAGLRKLGTGTLVLAAATSNITVDPMLDQGTLDVRAAFTGKNGTNATYPALNGTNGYSTFRAAAGTTLLVGAAGKISGGQGGTGNDNASGDAGTGGNGSTAVSFASNGTLVNAGIIAGGAGGNGGNSNARGGDGGFGGSGVLMGSNANVTNQAGASITGAAGGAAGSGGSGSGNAGNGGYGLSVGASSTVTNAGTISGATVGLSLGSGSTLTNTGTISGSGGQPAISATNATIVNSGTLSSGSQYNTTVSLSGTANTFELRSGYSIDGTVSAGGTADTLILGGSADATFALNRLGSQYLNFESLAKTGTGTWTLTNGTTYNGSVTVSAGTLQLGDGAIATTFTTPAIANQAALAFNPAGTSTFAGALSGSGTVTKLGAGTQVLSGANTDTGLFTVSSGSLQFARTVSFVNGQTASWDSAHLTVAPGATAAFNLGGTGEFGPADIQQIVGAAGVFQAGSSLGLDTSNAPGAALFNVSLGDSPAGALGLVKLGTGTLQLGAANTYSGGTTLTGGTIAISDPAQLGSGTVTFNGGALALLSSDLNLPQNINLNAATTLAVDGNLTLSGTLGGAGRLTKTGNATLTLSGTDTLGSNLAVSAGNLAVSGTLSGSAGSTGTADTASGAGTDAMTGADGTRVDIATTGSITAGAGGNGYNQRLFASGSTSSSPRYAGAGGGTAVSLGNSATLNNQGTVTGGAGGTGTVHTTTTSATSSSGAVDAGGAGGIGAKLGTGGTVVNSGAITGGAGGGGANGTSYIGNDGRVYPGGAGGTGLDLGTGAALTNTGSIAGGTGGTSGATYGAPGWGGAGGNGGTAASLGAGSTISSSGNVTGGNGGSSGLIQSTVSSYPDGNLHGDVGGAGGAGFSLGNTVALDNSGTIQGGNGGAGTSTSIAAGGGNPPTADPGNGGAAGTGIAFGSGGTLTNTGTIQGGNGGAGGVIYHNGSFSTTYGSGLNAAGGAAITGSGLAITNSGTIAAGLSGDGVTRGNAIVFSGTGNSLTLNPASVITGNVIGSATGTNTLALAGDTDAVLAGAIDAIGQYQNFTTLQKSGAGTWTLTGDSSFTGATTISSGTLQLGNGGATGSLGYGQIVNNAALVINRSDDLTVENAISGSGTFTKLGGGNVTLTGANSYAGATHLNGGTLSLVTAGGATSLGTGTLVNFDGGTLAFTGEAYAGDIAGQFATSGTPDYRIDTTTTSVTFNTGIGAGAGSLTKLGDGTLILAADNFHTGGTTITAGSLEAAQPTALGSGKVIFAGGTLVLDGGSVVGNDLLFNGDGGSIQTDAPDPITLTGQISGAGGLGKFGGGTLVIANATPDFTGGVNLSNGALILGNAGALQGNIFNLGNGVHLDFGTNTSQDFGSLSGSGTLTLTNTDGAAVALSIGSNNSSTIYKGRFYGLGSITKVGTGTFTLFNDNSYAGDTTIAGGTLEFSRDGQLGAATGNLVLQGGTLHTLANVSSARTVTVSGSSTIEVDAGLSSSFGALSGGGALTKAGDGTLSLGLSNFSGYTGNLAIASGTLDLRADGEVGYGGGISGGGVLSKSGAGTLTLTGANPFTGNATIADGTLQIGAGGSGQGVISGFAAITDNGVLAFNHSDSFTYSGVISGSGALTKLGTGTLTLSGNNSYLGGTTVSAGTLALGGSSAFGSGNVFVDANGTLDLGTNALDFSKVSGTGRVVTASPFAFATNSDMSLSLGLSGTASLNKSGTGTLTLSGASDYSGGTTLSDGTIAIANNSALGTGSVTLNGGSLEASGGARTLANTVILNGDTTLGGAQNLTLDGSFVLARNRDLTVANTAVTTINGVISQSGGTRALLKYGDGELRLNGANLYTGGTTIAEGTVRINNSTGSAFGTGAVTVEQGAILAGSGSFTGALQLNGTLSPGNSPGSLTTGSTVWAGGAGYLWQINDGDGLPGVNFDFTQINGTLTIEADAATPFTFSLVSLLANDTAGDVAHFDATRDHSYTFATASLGIIGFNTAGFTIDASAFTNDLRGGHWAIVQDGQNLNLLFTAATVPVPEPATFALLAGLATLGLALLRRRRS